MRLDNKADIDRLRAAMNAALAQVAAELGLEKLRAGNVKYEDGGAGATIQVKAEVIVGGKTKHAIAFDQYHEMFGLRAEQFGAKFHARDGQYEIVGLAPSRTRFPIMAIHVATGKTMFFTVDGVLRQLNKAEGGLTRVEAPPRT